MLCILIYKYVHEKWSKNQMNWRQGMCHWNLPSVCDSKKSEKQSFNLRNIFREVCFKIFVDSRIHTQIFLYKRIRYGFPMQNCSHIWLQLNLDESVQWARSKSLFIGRVFVRREIVRCLVVYLTESIWRLICFSDFTTHSLIHWAGSSRCFSQMRIFTKNKFEIHCMGSWWLVRQEVEKQHIAIKSTNSTKNLIGRWLLWILIRRTSKWATMPKLIL